MKWIQNSVFNVTTDSNAWENYRDVSYTYIYPIAGTKYYNTNTLLNTGASVHNRAKNINDLAGNLWKWTNEVYSNDYVLEVEHTIIIVHNIKQHFVAKIQKRLRILVPDLELHYILNN